ncbi:MAG TPA: nucleotide exchange factor GrpE [Terriglobales bacterium]|nr:nucleotide exchange factor GrpE [Terriglobales bacterium]
MGKGNGKTEARFHLENQDLERELPAAEGGEESDPVLAAAKPADVGAASEVEKLKAEREALLDRLARLQAEFDNARKRAVREQQEFREFAAAEVIRNLLPIIDSFERALKAGGDATDFRNGIELIYRQFQDALQKIGVQPIAALGQPFDPRVHEAIEMVDSTEVPDHHVLDELQRGYKYKDRLLRPAMVRVARNSRG